MVGRADLRCLSRNEDRRGNNATSITESNLHGRSNGALVVSSHAIADPSQCEGLRDVTTWGDQEEREVLDTDRETPVETLADKDDVPDTGDYKTKHAEGVAMLDLIGNIRCDESCAGGDNEDWN